MASMTAFDTLAEDHWSNTERANAELVHRFVELLMNDHDFDTIRDEFAGTPYVQHNRTIPDGLEGVLATIGRTVKRYPEYSYDVKRLIPSGDVVVVFSHATMKAADRGDDEKGVIIFDMWRVEDGNVVEHWDSIQALDLPMRMYLASTSGKISLRKVT